MKLPENTSGPRLIREALESATGISPIEAYLRDLHARHAGYDGGTVANYIPELAKVKREWFGICIATRDGHVYEIGDTRQAFTIQSVSKALSYGLALEDRGEAHVLSRISVEPSGDAFNAISLRPDNGAPFNPMINAGAIATCGQVLARPGESRIARILAYLSGCAGRDLDIDEEIYRSESETGYRNRAIGWMLRNFGIIDEEPTDILETYFRQCSIRVTCRDLAVMAATLANQGVNPLTKVQAIAPAYVDNILSVMATCGMYDFSGEWLYRVGLPAKSGVGGGIMAVLPGQIGIGIFSPPLDSQGNSARGIRVCDDLSRELALHVFHNGVASQPALRLAYNGSQVTSRRRRPPAQHAALQANGHRIQMYELQGDLIFSTLEPVVRSTLDRPRDCRHILLNLLNVASTDAVSLTLLAQLQETMSGNGVRLLFSHAGACEDALIKAGVLSESLFSSDDAALENCENHLLAELLGPDWARQDAVSLAQCTLLASASADDVDWLDQRLPEMSWQAGESIVRAGEPGDSLYLILSGSVEVRLARGPNDSGKRLDCFVAGMAFGEMGLIDGSPRSAHVIANAPTTCRVLDLNVFRQLDLERPALKIALLQQLTRQLSGNLRRTNAEILAYRG